MRIHVNPASEHLRSFAEHLPELFENGGEVLHTGRNTIKAVSLSGQLLGNYLSADTVFEGELKYPERFIVLVIEPENGKTTTLKLLDSKL